LDQGYIIKFRWCGFKRSVCCCGEVVVRLVGDGDGDASYMCVAADSFAQLTKLGHQNLRCARTVCSLCHDMGG